MTGFLASVTGAEEAALALDAGADIIDLKDPAQGALGALPAPVIEAAVMRIGGRRPVSATAGDLAPEPEIMCEAVARIAGTGVNLVKIGLFPGGDAARCLARLGRQAERPARLVAVLFADLEPDLGLIEAAADSGFAGVMLDTGTKDGRGLRAHLHDTELEHFVARARARGLLSGLAGSLSLADVAPLLGLGPDYLGFRGALTTAGRGSALDPEALAAVRAAIPADHQVLRASSATAAAGAQRAASSRASGSPSISSAKSL